MTEILATPKDVIEALGGTAAVCELTNSKASAVSNWRNFDRLPSNTYVVMTRALRALGKSAPDSLWGMRALPEAERVA